jgi:probable F420-dependent oxidoreductase
MKFFAGVAMKEPRVALEIARQADECGIDGVFLGDHPMFVETITSKTFSGDGSHPGGADTPWPEPMVMIAAMAAMTRRLEFITSVYLLPERNVFAAAHAVNTASVIAGGRIRLGIGSGWVTEEYELMGQDWHSRGRRLDEMIEALRLLATGEMVEYHGKHISFPRLTMRPALGQSVPIYICGISEAAIKRAARLGDGLVGMPSSIEEFAAVVARTEKYRQELGRQHEPFDYIAIAYAKNYDDFRRLEEVGATGAYITTSPSSTEDFQRFVDDIAARFR